MIRFSQALTQTSIAFSLLLPQEGKISAHATKKSPGSIVMLATKFVFIAFGAYQVVLTSFNYSLLYETM